MKSDIYKLEALIISKKNEMIQSLIYTPNVHSKKEIYSYIDALDFVLENLKKIEKVGGSI